MEKTDIKEYAVFKVQIQNGDETGPLIVEFNFSPENGPPENGNGPKNATVQIGSVRIPYKSLKTAISKFEDRYASELVE